MENKKTFARSNYEQMRDRMRVEFLKYDQEKMIQKYSLKFDGEYLYLDFVGRLYRVNRRNGIVEWSEDHFSTVAEGDYNESMTIYDVLCYAREDCSLSGRYCSLNMLKGTVRSAAPGGNLFQKSADAFCGKTRELEAACISLGEKTEWKGDVAVKMYPFTFLPVILQYWDGDDEFPASLKFMFDEHILEYMHYETIFFMISHILKRIKEIMGICSQE